MPEAKTNEKTAVSELIQRIHKVANHVLSVGFNQDFQTLYDVTFRLNNPDYIDWNH